MAVWLVEFGMSTAEYASPVIEKVESSTPVARMPIATGKVEVCEDMVILWSTIVFRSPCASVEPLRSANFFCWRIDLSDSDVGVHVAFCFFCELSRSVV